MVSNNGLQFTQKNRDNESAGWTQKTCIRINNINEQYI